MMGNAVWVYLTDDMTTVQGISKFIEWARKYNVSKVILHFHTAEIYAMLSGHENVQEFITRCKAESLEVHGMISTLMSVPTEFLEPEYEHCFAVDFHGCSNRRHPPGGKNYFLDPNQPQVVGMLRDALRNLVTLYPLLDGVQLDFIRYYHFASSVALETASMGNDLRVVQPRLELSSAAGQAIYFLRESQVQSYDPMIGGIQKYYHNYFYCFCEKCLTDFGRHTNLAISLDKSRQEIAREILENYAEKWQSFRAEIITKLVRELAQEIRQLGPEKQLSATFWYNSPFGNQLIGEPFHQGSELRDFGQAWWEWAKEGLVDFLCPMNYWLEPYSYGEIVKQQVAKIKAAVPLYSGLLYSQDYPQPQGQLDLYLELAELGGARGTCFFSYNSWGSDSFST